MPALARVLARAFLAEPSTAWLLPDEQSRLQRLERSFTAYLRHIYLPLGHCYTTDRVAGGAIWAPPGRWRVGLRRELMVLPATVRAYGRWMPRLIRSGAVDERHHPENPPHWYLALLGVEPDAWGRGLGSELLRPVLDRSDSTGTPCYLETLDPRARALYERNGFEVRGEHTYPGSGLQIFRMWREPRLARP